MMLNQNELRSVVKKHCGHKLEKKEPVCKFCEKKLNRAIWIDRQIDDMWKKFRSGYYDRPKRKGPRRENNEVRRSSS